MASFDSSFLLLSVFSVKGLYGCSAGVDEEEVAATFDLEPLATRGSSAPIELDFLLFSNCPLMVLARLSGLIWLWS
jgi:hypothetical protein